MACDRSRVSQSGRGDAMSVLDQVRALEQQVLQRLRELRPLVAEYRDLEKVAERLGLSREQDEPIAAAQPSASEPSTPPKPAVKRRAKRATGASRSKAAAAGRAAATGAAAPTAAAEPKAKAATTKAKAKPKAAAKSKPTAAAQRRPGARKRGAAAPGQRERDVLRLVRERQGITVAELARELQVDATGLYGVVRRLVSRGEIAKDGTQLHASLPASAAPEAPGNPAPAAVGGDASTPSTDESQAAQAPD